MKKRKGRKKKKKIVIKRGRDKDRETKKRKKKKEGDDLKYLFLLRTYRNVYIHSEIIFKIRKTGKAESAKPGKRRARDRGSD